MHISATPDADIQQVGERIKGLDPVLQVFYTTGEMTFMAYAACKTMLEASNILQQIRGMSGVERVVPHSILRMF
jgi:DNA-binding Lrp family transcriptional regulator